MQAKLLNFWGKTCLILFFALLGLQLAMAQDAQTQKEITEAIDNAKNGEYQQAIPVLKKYADAKGFDDLTILQINVYLNFCYLATKNIEALNVDNVNKLFDSYKSVSISSSNGNPITDDAIMMFYLTSIMNSSTGNYNKSVEILEFTKKQFEKKSSDQDKDYLQILFQLARGYYNLLDYSSAITLCKELLKISYTLFGEYNETSLGILDLLYSSSEKVNNISDAIIYLQKWLEIGLEIYGEENEKYITQLSNLSLAFYYLGDYNNAMKNAQKVVQLGKETLGEKDPDYLSCYANLSVIYSSLGEYRKALEIDQKIAEIRKELLGEKHPDYINSLNNLATTLSYLGYYSKSLEINQKVIKLGEEVLGENHPDFLLYLSNLGSTYDDLGDYDKALFIDIKVSDLRKKILGEKHPAYLTSLSNLSNVYSDLGEYQKALEIDQKIAEIRKEVLGEKHPDYSSSLSNLAVDYNAIGDHQNALKVGLKVVELDKETLGEKHPDYLTSLSNLAVTYSELGDNQKALELNQKVYEIQKEVFGENHPEVIVSLNNLAFKYSKLNDYNNAAKLYLKAFELGKEFLPKNHPTNCWTLSQLGVTYLNMHDYKKASEVLLKCFELSKGVFGIEHPNYLNILGYLAAAELNLSETNSALDHYLQMLTSVSTRVIRYFNLMTETQRELFWEQYSRDFAFFPKFLEKTTNAKPEATGDAYDIALFTKGLLLNTSIDFNQLIAEKGSPEAKAKFEELKLLRLQIQKLNEKPIAERYLNVDSLENIAQQKETELVKISKEYGDYTRNLKINWQDVQANLKDNDVAIEFVEYPTLTDTVKYAALVLRKGWQYPQMISLFRKDQIDAFIKQDKNKIYSNGFVGKQIRQLVWEPLGKVVSPGERVYFSPAGIYHQLAIENLAASDSTTLGDIYQMYRLSSTKELVIQTPKSKYKTAVLYGGLQYDLDSVKMVAESKKYPEVEKLLAFRGYSNDTTVRKGWEYLGGTLQEVEQINRLMNSKQYLVTEYTGETGNEESFKALSGKSPEIIHIATHGFFQPVEESRKNPFMQMRMGDQRESGGVDPMLRSGLMLSGGNKAWQGEKIPENIEDGVLTAREISRMDLRGTDLVVLSACETGLGEVSGEGVFGLQRSFKQAGVKNLIMSLWEVSDQATSFMMKEFYTNLLSGEELRKAFVDAKQKCKQQFPEPQYWAAFVLLN